MATDMRFRVPMLATLTEDYFDNENWIFERKLDGERALAYKSGSEIKLLSRNNKDLNFKYPELVAALKKEKNDFIVDGEIVVLVKGKTDFTRLGERMFLSNEHSVNLSTVKVNFFLFDILELNGQSTEKVAQIERKLLLKKSLKFYEPVRYLEHIKKNGLKYHEMACGKGWEGIIAKDAKASYVHLRSRSWLKFKCAAGQEMVIAGYTDPQGSRTGFGALLLGFYRKGKLVYAGRVGTGFSDQLLSELLKKLKKLETDKNPFAEGKFSLRGVHFVSPKLVGEIGFTEWTKDDSLRHPRFLGLRADKPARQVKKET